VKNKETREPADAMKIFGLMMQMLEQGYVSFVCGRNGNVFRLMPPLTTPYDYFDAAVDTLIATIKRNEVDLQSF
jgi:4-aminobutyrate aminotransferase-like enzyme